MLVLGVVCFLNLMAVCHGRLDTGTYLSYWEHAEFRGSIVVKGQCCGW